MEYSLELGEISSTIARQKNISIVLLMQIWIQTMAEDMEIIILWSIMLLMYSWALLPTSVMTVIYKTPLLSYRTPTVGYSQLTCWNSDNDLSFDTNHLKILCHVCSSQMSMHATTFCFRQDSQMIIRSFLSHPAPIFPSFLLGKYCSSGYPEDPPRTIIPGR